MNNDTRLIPRLFSRYRLVLFGEQAAVLLDRLPDWHPTRYRLITSLQQARKVQKKPHNKLLTARAVDPDPLGSAFIFPPGSGSTFKMRIRIQVGKF